MKVSVNLFDKIQNECFQGYDGEERAYIATQGPLPHTVSDFWTMVWAEHPPTIVMITKLWEKGRPKCEAYFPHGEPGTHEATASYGDIIVTVVSLTHRDGYTIRELQVQVCFSFHLLFP